MRDLVRVFFTLSLGATLLGQLPTDSRLETIVSELEVIDAKILQLSQDRLDLMEELSHYRNKQAVRILLEGLTVVDPRLDKSVTFDYLVDYGEFAVPVILDYIENYPRATNNVSTAVLALAKIKGDEFLEFAKAYWRENPESNAARHLKTWASIDL